jgi:phospholipase C
MMLKWVPEILSSPHFRCFNDLAGDLMNSSPDELPQVIFVEPTYQDAPHLGFATDEHAPSGVSNGQEFLMQVYNALVNSPFWQKALMIVDYDENGAFFDHVSPPMISTDPQTGAAWKDMSSFVSLGPRIPAYVISPYVKPGSVSHTLLDHTSVLKLIGEKFSICMKLHRSSASRFGTNATSSLTNLTANKNDPRKSRCIFSPAFSIANAARECMCRPTAQNTSAVVAATK